MKIRDILTDNTVVEVFSGNIWEAEMVKRFLDNSDIGAFLRHRNMKKPNFDPAKLNGVQVMIVESDLAEAKQVLKDLLMEIEEFV